MLNAVDRVPLHPGRVQMTPVDGAANLYDMVRADEPSQVGTPINRRALQLLQADRRTYPVAAGQSVQAGDVVDVVDGKIVAGVRKQLGEFTPGSIVQIKEGGTTTDFYVAGHNYESGLNGAGRTLLVRKDCCDSRAMHSADVNAYAVSDLDRWLNTEYQSLLDADTHAAMGTTKFIYTPGNGNTATTTLQRAIFLLSLEELGVTDSSVNREGTVLASAEVLRIVLKFGIPSVQWTRSPNAKSIAQQAVVRSDGTGYVKSSPTTSCGSRPAFTLPETFTVFTGEIGSQAIALQNGTAGQTIEVIFGGTAELPGVAAGREIMSPGVYGYCPEDGRLWVRPEWDARYMTGGYIGTGTYGAGNAVVIKVGFKPSMIVVLPIETFYNYKLLAVAGMLEANTSGSNHGVSITWMEDGISFYAASTAASQMNEKKAYRYIAFR